MKRVTERPENKEQIKKALGSFVKVMSVHFPDAPLHRLKYFLLCFIASLLFLPFCCR